MTMLATKVEDPIVIRTGDVFGYRDDGIDGFAEVTDVAVTVYDDGTTSTRVTLREKDPGNEEVRETTLSATQWAQEFRRFGAYRLMQASTEK